MIIELLKLEFIRKKYEDKNIKNSNLKLINTYMGMSILIFMVFLWLCTQIDNSTYSIIVINLSIFMLFILQGILNLKIKNIKKDPILIFIKKEQYTFIKRNIQLNIYKAIMIYIIPMLVPLIIYSDNKLKILIIIYLSLMNFYILNMIMSYTLSYIDAVSNKSILNKCIYIFLIISCFIALFLFEVYMIGEIINALLKNQKNTFNIYCGTNIMVLSITAILGLALEFIILNLVKKNLYVILNPLKCTRRLRFNVLNLKSTNIYIKILHKDIICFLRKKGIEFYVVAVLQIAMFILYCLTILQERHYSLIGKLYIVSLFYIVCCFSSIFLIILVILLNKDEITVVNEVRVLRTFNIDVNKLKILKQKSNYIFILLSFNIITTGLINFFMDISMFGIIQTMLILICVLSWMRYCSLMAVDFVNFRFNETRIIIFLIISLIGTKIMTGIFIFDEFKNSDQLFIKYSIVALINVIGYLIEFIMIKFFEREIKND